MMDTTCTISPIWLTLLCATIALTGISTPTFADCALSKLAISSGMMRSEVEHKVANALGTTSNYSAYANNLSGGIVEYHQTDCVLKVKYLRGAAAPLIATPQNQVQHLSPQDETVAAYKLLKTPASPKTSTRKKITKQD